MSWLKHHTAFLSVMIVMLVSHVFWVRLDQSPALWDIAGHSQRAVEVAQLLRSGDLGAALTQEGIYPPFTYAVTALFFLLFGMHTDVPQYSLAVWLALLGISLYSIGLKLFQRRDVATLAVAFCLASPLLAHFSRIYDLDFPLTATVTAAIAALLHTKQFTHKGWSIVFGVCAGSALLTKWTAVVFLIAPTLCVLLPAFRGRYEHRRKIKHITLAATAALLIAAPWYALHTVDVLYSASATRNNVFSVPHKELLTIGNITFYAQWIVRGITWPVALVAAVGIIATFFRRKFADGVLLLWVAVPYLIMTFALYSKESRYLLPVFPALALLSAALLVHLRAKKQFAFAALTGSIVLIFWLQTSWNATIIPRSAFPFLKLQTTYGLQTISPEKPYFGFTYPTQYHTNVYEVVNAIAIDVGIRPSRETIRIAVVPNSIFLTAQQIQFYSRLSGLDNPANNFTIDYSLSSAIRNAGWEEKIVNADYLITKTGDQGPSVWGPALPKIATAEKRGDAETFGQFELLQSWTLSGIEQQPQTMRLYRKKF